MSFPSIYKQLLQYSSNKSLCIYNIVNIACVYIRKYHIRHKITIEWKNIDFFIIHSKTHKTYLTTITVIHHVLLQ